MECKVTGNNTVNSTMSEVPIQSIQNVPCFPNKGLNLSSENPLTQGICFTSKSFKTRFCNMLENIVQKLRSLFCCGCTLKQEALEIKNLTVAFPTSLLSLKEREHRAKAKVELEKLYEEANTLREISDETYDKEIAQLRTKNPFHDFMKSIRESASGSVLPLEGTLPEDAVGSTRRKRAYEEGNSGSVLAELQCSSETLSAGLCPQSELIVDSELVSSSQAMNFKTINSEDYSMTTPLLSQQNLYKEFWGIDYPVAFISELLPIKSLPTENEYNFDSATIAFLKTVEDNKNGYYTELVRLVEDKNINMYQKYTHKTTMQSSSLFEILFDCGYKGLCCGIVYQFKEINFCKQSDIAEFLGDILEHMEPGTCTVTKAGIIHMFAFLLGRAQNAHQQNVSMTQIINKQNGNSFFMELIRLEFYEQCFMAIPENSYFNEVIKFKNKNNQNVLDLLDDFSSKSKDNDKKQKLEFIKNILYGFPSKNELDRSTIEDSFMNDNTFNKDYREANVFKRLHRTKDASLLNHKKLILYKLSQAGVAYYHAKDGCRDAFFDSYILNHSRLEQYEKSEQDQWDLMSHPEKVNELFKRVAEADTISFLEDLFYTDYHNNPLKADNKSLKIRDMDQRLLKLWAVYQGLPEEDRDTQIGIAICGIAVRRNSHKTLESIKNFFQGQWPKHYEEKIAESIPRVSYLSAEVAGCLGSSVFVRFLIEKGHLNVLETFVKKITVIRSLFSLSEQIRAGIKEAQAFYGGTYPEDIAKQLEGVEQQLHPL